jgi:hypothetical protein
MIDTPTWWALQCKRYDRINADRRYLSESARAKRHFGIKKRVKKHSRRRSKR